MEQLSDLLWLSLIQNSLSDKLPNDVVLEVLQRLPVKSILRFKCVSKLWCSLLSHPNFVRIHLNNAISGNTYILIRHAVLAEEYSSSSDSDIMNPVDDEEVKREIFSLRSKKNCEELGTLQVPIPSSTSYYSLIGCLNGLVCINESNILGRYHTLNMSFWNPATREVRSLPRYFIRRRRSDSFHIVGLGFGHEPITNDYKVVRFIYFILRKTYAVETYSLRRDCWKRISADNLYNCYFHYLLPQATTNGALHWLAYRGLLYEKDNDFIIAFHIDQEKLSSILLPTFDREDRFSHICSRVSVYKDQLALFTHSSLEEDETFHVWIMKEYGNVKSWTYLFSIHQEELTLPPLHFVDDSLVIMRRRDDGEMVLCDSTSFSQIGELNVSSWSRATDYVESLVSPRVTRSG